MTDARPALTRRPPARAPLLEVCGLLGSGWGRGAAGVIELLAGEPECVLKEMLSERQGWPIGQADTASGR